MILPPLTRFRMVILPTVGCASLTHGWDTITALRFRMVILPTVGWHPFRRLTPIPWVNTRGCVISPRRGSIWYVTVPRVSTRGCVISPRCGSVWYFTSPWVTLRSTHGCVISPLRSSKRLLCNNYELCIMNYALSILQLWCLKFGAAGSAERS